LSKAVYVYGVIDFTEKTTPGFPRSPDGKDAYAVPYHDIACIARPYPESFFNSAVREKVARELLSHQTLIEEIMKSHSILPFKFGTLLENEDEVRRVLEENYLEFKEKLMKIEGKIELDVVAFWPDMYSVIRQMGEEDEQILSLKRKAAEGSPADNVQDKVNLGRLISLALHQRRMVMQKAMLETLNGKVRIDDCKAHELFDDAMIFNYAFLIDKTRESEFDRALGELNALSKEKVHFRCVGPLPPYSFFTHVIQKMNARVLDDAAQTLGLQGREFDLSDIKNAYRQLVREKHPDKHSGRPAAQEQFKDIQESYKQLLAYCRDVKKPQRQEEVKDFYVVKIWEMGHAQ